MNNHLGIAKAVTESINNALRFPMRNVQDGRINAWRMYLSVCNATAVRSNIMKVTER